MSDRFTEKAENALNRSVKIAEKFGHTYIGSEHLLLALSEDDTSCASLILKKNGIGKDKIYTCIKEYSGIGVKSNLSSKDLTPRSRKILESSYNNANHCSESIIGTEHILLSIVEEKDCVAFKLLKSMRADTGLIREDINTLIKSRERTICKAKRDVYPPVILQYGKNLCELAKAEKFDPVTGRDKETDRIIRVLSRKNKNNPCLIGEAGVGKTAIIEGLAQRIVNNDVPPSLIGKTIISLDLTSMVAGAKYRGDFEDRIKNILNEVVKHKDIILFIDEIHTIVGAGAAEGAIDASNILKPQLARGEVQVIGATTYEEYRKYIERDAALERRFQPIQINEPSVSETTAMLHALKERYEKHHNVTIEDAAIEECVILSSRYITDRFLPDKAIDMLDEACALLSSKLINNKNNEYISRQFDDINYQSSDEIKRIYEGEYPDLPLQNQESQRPVVTVSVIKDIISEACGIPVSMLRKSIDYHILEKNLKDAVLGQEDAIHRLVAAIKRSDLGFLNENRPRGIFLFVGESGVGKTELAIELEKNLFYDSSSLLRFDMSEYSEKQSISKLIGSPPGYVGHDEGGALTEAIKKRPHSVILFDEIEKADKEVLNILLQISDYGYIRDSVGKRISFRNAVIIATSNLGAPRTVERVGFENNFEQNYSGRTNIESLKKYYKEEFINRFDEVIYFLPLSDDTLKNIAIKKMNKIRTELLRRGCEFTFSDEIINHLVLISKSKGLGARPILREISVSVEDKLIDLLMSRDSSICSIEANLEENKIVFAEKNVLKA